MTKRIRAHFLAIALVLAGGLFAACSNDNATAPAGGKLAGLNETTPNDSASTSGQNNSGPGSFHGTVLGQSAPGAGNDSLASAPRISNVRVTIYQEVRTATGVETGTEFGSVVTGADGLFTLPTLPAGEYVVTFVPPSDGPYHGVYAFGALNENSSKYPWWVVLGKK